MQPPLNLMILSTVRKYGSMPKSLLYSLISAPPQDVEKYVQTLAAQGALVVNDDQISAGADDARG